MEWVLQGLMSRYGEPRRHLHKLAATFLRDEILLNKSVLNE